MKQPHFLKEKIKSHPEYRYFLFIPGYLLCFFLAERLVPSDADYWISYIPLDDGIPFVEAFVIPYCLWYPLLLAAGLALMFTDADALRRYVRFLILGFGFSLLFCLLFPNGQNLRPDPFPRRNFFTWLLGLLYTADTNTNVLPSMHVIGCAAAACAAFDTKGPFRRWRWPVLALAVLISVSTVFVKQHSVLDIFAGLAVCVPIWFFLYFRKKRNPAKNV